MNLGCELLTPLNPLSVEQQTCPCCGQSVSHHKLLVDLNTNRAVYRGREIDLGRPQVAELVYALANAWPKVVSLSEITFAMWGHGEPEWFLSSIRVAVSRARKKLDYLGISIVTEAARGYRIVLSPEDKNAPAD